MFALFLSAGSVLAQFEGVMEMKTTTSGQGAEFGGGGTMVAAVSKAGTRCEMNMQMGGMGMKMVMLQKTDTPDLAYHINDAQKTYTEINLAKMREKAGTGADESKYTVEKLGQETILGYKTVHVLVKEQTTDNATGKTTEMWTAKDLMDYATFSKWQVRRGKGAGE